MIEECLVVEFAVTGDGCPLAEAAGGVTIDARPPQLRDDGYALLQFSAPDDPALASRLDGDDRLRYLHRARVEGRANFRCLSKAPCVVHDLVSEGFAAESLTYRDGSARFTGAVVGHEVLRGVMDRAGETVGVDLERVSPLGADGDVPVAQRWDLTPPQEAALRAAVAAGYFAVPREADAADVAEDLEISKSAFLERLRRAQRGLFEQLLA
ncbi:transcriptional regulator [Halobacteriales archaeon QS_5_70_17]|nr:MAG: transcriptional regulator [Halobacteriales archaeon QS_5_70_17]